MENQLNFAMIMPELVLCILAMLVLVLNSFIRSKHSAFAYVASLISVAIVAAVVLCQWNNGVSGTAFFGMYVNDNLAHFLKLVVCVAVFITLVYSRQYTVDRQMAEGGEIYALSLFCLLGQMVMISAANLLTVYLGLELMSLSLYALVGVRRESLEGAEAAMKYFILGSLASGVFLYGVSLVYGATSHLDLDGVVAAVNSGNYHTWLLMIGVVFIVCGIAFKLGAVPFHMWLPDVYQGAPTAITLTIAAAPKVAAFAMALRVLIVGLHGSAQSWQMMLMILAVLSLAIGNLTALMQTNFKRMLAYSTISHIGFVLLGLLAGVDASGQVVTGAYGSALFYLVTYVITTLASFGIVLVLARSGFEADSIEDFKGLNRRSPLLAFAVLLLMFSLAGIPPLVGFYAKLSVLEAVIHMGHIWLAIVAVLFSLIGAFYYLRIVKVMYFDEPKEDAPVIVGSFNQGLLSINSLVILVLGLLPGGLMALCVQVIDTSLKF